MTYLTLAGLSRQERQILSHCSAMESMTVNSDHVIEVLPCSRAYANTILSRLALKGWLQRLKAGVYSIVSMSSLTAEPVIEDAWSLAIDLFKPAFISGWTAAEHWGLTEQIFNDISIVSNTEQRQTEQTIGGIKFKIRMMNAERFFGFQSIWHGSKKIEIANPSRMIIDILDMPSFGGGSQHTIDIINQYWTSDLKNPDLLLEYALKYNKGVVFKRMGFLAESLKAPVTEQWLKTCQQNISKGISSLDPHSSPKGKICTKWNLKINCEFKLNFS